MSDVDLFSKAIPPWIVVKNKSIDLEFIPDNIRVITLDAQNMKNLNDMYLHFSNGFKFPDYFGNNLNSMDECLTDLEWLPADSYLLVFYNADWFLNEENEVVLDGVLSILNSAGAEWSTPIKEGSEWDRCKIPFHTVFIENEDSDHRIERAVKKVARESSI